MNQDGKRGRPYETILPLANSLSLTPDTSCTKSDASCVASLVSAYTGFQNILICWEHSELTDIATALGDPDAPTYPSSKYVVPRPSLAPVDDVWRRH